MNALLLAVLVQAFYYSIAMGFVVVAVSFLLKGFFWSYVKVRFSFGRLLLVKPRSVLHDYVRVGRIEDGFLIYKVKTVDGKEEKRISIDPNNRYIYRFLTVNWIDVDEEKNALCKCDYTPVMGYDAKKFSDLLVRCLQKPAILNNIDKIIIAGVIGLGILSVVGIYLGYVNMKNTTALTNTLNAMRGVITGG